MNVNVDLTGAKFDDYHSISFYDSKTIFFDATTVLPDTVSFKIWGAGLMPAFDWSYFLDLEDYPNLKQIREQSPVNETVIQGFGTLTLNEVVAGKLVIEPLSGKRPLKDHRGRKVAYKREWTMENVDSKCYVYTLDTNIYFPYGLCELKLYAKGAVAFAFNTDDCVSYMEYITNPDRQKTFWGYLQDKSLTTHSYKYEDLDSEQ